MSAIVPLRRILLAAGLGILAGSSSGQVIPQSMPAPTQTVSPVGGQHVVTPFRPSADLQIARPDHPPLDQIPPMPLPNSDDYVPGVQPPGGVMLHDATTGQTTLLPSMRGFSRSDWTVAPEGDYPGADNYVEGEPNTRGFGTMSAAGSLNTWPRSGNVKLVMEFIDQNGISRWFTASGSMQDAGVVLTAAHCVYSRAPNGINIFDWANRIYIYPAWDGDAAIPQFGEPASDDVVQYFGYCRGDYFMAGSNYVNNGDFDSDVGCIRINRGSSRNIGMLTGWFAWAYGGTCAWHQDRTYNNFSYPAENCGGGLHTGRTMYYWSGTWDSCPGNQMHLITGGNCLDTVWGGMSGSGAYYIEGDSRYVHAVCSNSNRNDSGNYARLWETYVNSMIDFENDTRGNTFDAELLRCRALGSTTIKAGTSANDIFQVYVANATNNDPGSQGFTLRVYLSSNNNISTSDTLLGTWNYNWDFAAMSGVIFNIPAPFIPADVTPGTYWIGAILDDGTDAWIDNNDTDTWDAQQVSITLADPATPTYVSPANNSTGNAITVDLDWNPAARATSYDVYFGTDSTPDATEYQGNTAASFWALGTLAFDTQYYWQIVARNSAGITVGPVWTFRTEPSIIDLASISCNADAGTYYRGQTIPVDFVVQNIGNTASLGYDVELRISTNQIISVADALMTTVPFGSLGAGSTRTTSNYNAQIPLTLSPGVYYVGQRLTGGGDTATGNNYIADSDTITVLACNADFAAPYGVLNFFDVQHFLNLFSAHNPAADVNNDGQWNFFDVQTYLSWFSAGC
ncbi:MAG: hypothetical protein DYG94_13500 [Leptolyngbya sp. PLA3]|nr:MAG: hypothetical protein EDM82_14055 [Cyanobacteria bacterium CYA]MCE7969741.1 hypothetical protein [Leptolyngbya sp. PL-A3]